MNHLLESLRAVAQADNSVRIERILAYRWIKYPAAEQILNRLEELLAHPKIARMPDMLLVSETNNGKSVLIDRFCQLHKPYTTLEDEKVVRPVVSILAPAQPDEKRFYCKLLDQLRAPYGVGDRVERLEKQTLHVMQRVNTRVLIIDEIHNMLVGTSRRQRAFLNVLKNMSIELQLVIVAAGTMEARNVMSSDPQMVNRFVPTYLPKWHCNEEFQHLLVSFERLLPLRKPSNLADPLLAERIYDLSEGTIGEISTVLTMAAVEAINSGEERISGKLLDRIKLRYVSPSDRRRAQKALA